MATEVLLLKGIMLMMSSTFEEYCNANNIVSNTTRLAFFNTESQLKVWPFFSPFNNVIRSLDLSSEDLFSDFNYNFRKNLRSSLNKELRLIIDTEGFSISDFIEIYLNTMKRNNASSYYYFKKSFFENLIKNGEQLCIL